MKRNIIFLLMAIILVGCSENKTDAEVDEVTEEVNSVEEFIELYNDRVDTLIENDADVPEMEKLSANKVGKLEEREHDYIQTIKETSMDIDHGMYKVGVKYDEYNNLAGFEVFLMGHPEDLDDDGNVYYSDKGISSATIVADLLGLNTTKFSDKLSEAFDEEITNYAQNGYDIHFVNKDRLGTMLISFDKTE